MNAKWSMSFLLGLVVLASGCMKQVDDTASMEEAVAVAPATAEMREGVDIVGFDLFKVEGTHSDPRVCQKVCEDTEACKAWTLSLQDGACWLKSGVDRLHESPYAVSGLKAGTSWP